MVEQLSFDMGQMYFHFDSSKENCGLQSSGERDVDCLDLISHGLERSVVKVKQLPLMLTQRRLSSLVKNAFEH